MRDENSGMQIGGFKNEYGVNLEMQYVDLCLQYGRSLPYFSYNRWAPR